MQETWVWSLGWKIPWRRTWQPTPAFLPGESPQTEESVGCSPRGHKELDTTEWLSTAQYSRTVSGREGSLALWPLKMSTSLRGSPTPRLPPHPHTGRCPGQGADDNAVSKAEGGAFTYYPPPPISSYLQGVQWRKGSAGCLQHQEGPADLLCSCLHRGRKPGGLWGGDTMPVA